jgi:hypothetical protein
MLRHKIKSKDTVKKDLFVLTGKLQNFSCRQPKSQPAAAATGINKFKSEA